MFFYPRWNSEKTDHRRIENSIFERLGELDMGFIDDEFYKVHDKGEISTSERNTVYSTSKTKTALKILNDDQLKDIKKRLFKGGF